MNFWFISELCELLVVCSVKFVLVVWIVLLGLIMVVVIFVWVSVWLSLLLSWWISLVIGLVVMMGVKC